MNLVLVIREALKESRLMRSVGRPFVYDEDGA